MKEEKRKEKVTLYFFIFKINSFHLPLKLLTNFNIPIQSNDFFHFVTLLFYINILPT